MWAAGITNLLERTDMKKYFTKSELILWYGSVTAIIAAFLIFNRGSYMTLIASLIGVTSLIFNAKGNPFGQVLMVIFSLLYGIISYKFAYYGEMVTYLGMTMPMAVIALVSWLKNPYKGNKSEVAVNQLKMSEYFFVAVLTATVTVMFYFILDYFNTANMFFSTLSVATSFFAVYLTFRRSPFYAVGYAANDIVLIIMWIMAAKHNKSGISVAVCFAAFLINDLYGFINWKKMEKKQGEE
ncbi:MAG: nicotinamide mononucleotide transporter [Ruminococcus sp.]|nr:nicotinamide mononucleotide transporter [Ruminococcus sp.]